MQGVLPNMDSSPRPRFPLAGKCAERFANKTDALQQGPDALGSASNVEFWDASTSLLYAVRLDNAVEEAQARVKQRRDIRPDTSGHIPAKIIVDNMDRQYMERAYAAYNNGVRPPLEDQLNDTALARSSNKLRQEEWATCF